MLALEIGGCHPHISLVISTGNTSWPTSDVYRVITRLICASAIASQPGWPCAGGATGSIRFAPEINHGANAGLSAAVALLQPVHEKFPEVSWADLIQMASAVAIEVRTYHMPRLPQVAHAHGSSAAVNRYCSCMQNPPCTAIQPTPPICTITWPTMFLEHAALLIATDCHRRLHVRRAHPPARTDLLLALQLAGGPAIPLNYGRTDASSSADCAKEGFLPGGARLCGPSSQGTPAPVSPRVQPMCVHDRVHGISCVCVHGAGCCTQCSA